VRLIHERDTIRTVRNRWTEQYKKYDDGHRFAFGNKTVGQIRRELETLDLETCSAGAVEKVIGNDSWGAIKCCECRTPHPTLVSIDTYGGEYEVGLCLSCLADGIKMLARPA